MIKNMEHKVQIKTLFTCSIAKDIYANGNLLSYATSGASGFDIRAIKICNILNNTIYNLEESNFVLHPSTRCLVQTGLSFAIPDSFEMQVRPRSGLALKHGITVLNSPGTIDSDYRGEVGVILFNTSTTPFSINLGDRVAQIVVSHYAKGDFIITNQLNKSERGCDGFGSTGEQ